MLGHLKTKSMKSVTSKKTVDYAPGASYTSCRLLDTVLTTVFLAKCKYMICGGPALMSSVSRTNVSRQPMWKAEMSKKLKRRDKRERRKDTAQARRPPFMAILCMRITDRVVC